MPLTVVVTGASGFLGVHVTRALEARSDVRVVGVSRRHVPGLARVQDYRETPGGDVLIHLAENNDRGGVATADPQYVERSRSTLDVLLAKRFSRALYASSAALYGDTDPHPRAPSDPVESTDVYSQAKLQCERIALDDASGMVVRLANAYGHGMSPANVVSAILGQIPGAGPLVVRDVLPVRDFVWAGDAADAMLRLALASEPLESRTFNIGTGIGTSIGSVARIALDVAGQPDRPVAASSRGSRDSTLVVDYSETTEACGWTPRVDLKRGLQYLLSRREALR